MRVRAPSPPATVVVPGAAPQPAVARRGAPLPARHRSAVRPHRRLGRGRGPARAFAAARRRRGRGPVRPAGRDAAGPRRRHVRGWWLDRVPGLPVAGACSSGSIRPRPRPIRCPPSRWPTTTTSCGAMPTAVGGSRRCGALSARGSWMPGAPGGRAGWPSHPRNGPPEWATGTLRPAPRDTPRSSPRAARGFTPATCFRPMCARS